MSNPRELKKARDAAARAAWLLERIEALPRRKGSTVTWDNGVVWTRLGDDMWAAKTLIDGQWYETLDNDGDPIPYSSSHIASMTRKDEL